MSLTERAEFDAVVFEVEQRPLAAWTPAAMLGTFASCAAMSGDDRFKVVFLLCAAVTTLLGIGGPDALQALRSVRPERDPDRNV